MNKVLVFYVFLSVMTLFADRDDSIIPLRKEIQPSCVSHVIQWMLDMHGIDIDLFSIASLHDVNEKNESSLAEIQRILEQFGITTQWIQFRPVSFDQFSRLPFPFITHHLQEDSGHFIGVIGTDEDMISIRIAER